MAKITVGKPEHKNYSTAKNDIDLIGALAATNYSDPEFLAWRPAARNALENYTMQKEVAANQTGVNYLRNMHDLAHMRLTILELAVRLLLNREGLLD